MTYKIALCDDRAADREYAMSNTLGFGGHNGSILLKRWED